MRTIRRRSTLCSHSMLDRSCYCAVRARRRFTGPTSSKSSRERCTTVVRRCDIDMAGHKSAMESSLPSPTAGSEDRLPRLLTAFQPPVSSSGWSSPTVLGGCASSCFQRHASPSANIRSRLLKVKTASVMVVAGPRLVRRKAPLVTPFWLALGTAMAHFLPLAVRRLSSPRLRGS